jgi:hypothetical protein
MWVGPMSLALNSQRVEELLDKWINHKDTRNICSHDTLYAGAHFRLAHIRPGTTISVL